MKTPIRFVLLVIAVVCAVLRPAFADWEKDGGVFVVTSPTPVSTHSNVGVDWYSSSAFSVSASADSFWPPPSEDELTGSSSANVDVYFRQNYHWIGGGTPADFSVTTSGTAAGTASNIAPPAPTGASASSSSDVSTIGGTVSGGPSGGGSAPSNYSVATGNGSYTIANGSPSGTAYIKLRLKSYAGASQGVSGSGYSAMSSVNVTVSGP